MEESTAPVSTANKLKETIDRYKKYPVEIDVAVNPEFLSEGTGLIDFFNPDRIVLGVQTDKARDTLLAIYSPLIEKLELNDATNSTGLDRRFIITDLNTAEIIKHASNSFLATKISFINVVSDICESTGADILQVSHALGMDPRIGPDFLKAGLGFGGYCLPKDIRAFEKIGEDLGIDTSLFKSVSDVNQNRVTRVIEKLRNILWVLEDKSITIWGLSFKPGTDDVRESPSISLVDKLIQEGAKIKLHDPQASDEFKKIFPEIPGQVDYFDDPCDASIYSEAVIVATDWPEYKNVDFKCVQQSMAYPLLIDARNLLSDKCLETTGFKYIGLGR